MSLVTIFALVGDDIRLSSTRKELDNLMAAGMMLSLILFTVEILASSVVIDEYKYSFFFYLDIIATISIVFDIGFVFNFLLLIIGSAD